MKRFSNKDLTFDSFIFAIILILTFIKPLGYPQIGIIQATTIHIPVIIAIAYYKRYSKAIMFGLFFGISSLVSNVLVPNIFSPFFLNPLVSVLPRVLMAIIGCFIFKKIKVSIAAFITSYVNTILVLLSLTILYKAKISAFIPKFWAFIQTIVIINALLEAILAMLITTIIYKVAKK